MNEVLLKKKQDPLNRGEPHHFPSTSHPLLSVFYFDVSFLILMLSWRCVLNKFQVKSTLDIFQFQFTVFLVDIAVVSRLRFRGPALQRRIRLPRRTTRVLLLRGPHVRTLRGRRPHRRLGVDDRGVGCDHRFVVGYGRVPHSADFIAHVRLAEDVPRASKSESRQARAQAVLLPHASEALEARSLALISGSQKSEQSQPCILMAKFGHKFASVFCLLARLLVDL